jgi:polyisoprenyl-phosphate glycosyltransferase
MCKYSIVIPVYNSGKWIPELVERIRKTMEESGESFELLLVNDSSPDQITWLKIVEVASKYDWVRGFDLLYNVGQFRAILCGMDLAKGEYIITMDDDLQHPPEEIPKLMEKMEQNPEMECIIGAFSIKKHSLIRNLGSALFRLLSRKIYNQPKGFQGTNFRIMKRYIADALVNYKTSRPQIGPMILQTTTKIMNVTVKHESRKRGQSGYNIFRLFAHTMDSIINASIAPLRVFSVLGFITAGISFSIGVFYFIRWLMGSIKAPGFITFILLLTFFSGMILAGIGILGEYIARIITEITGHEKYHIRHSTIQQKKDEPD